MSGRCCWLGVVVGWNTVGAVVGMINCTTGTFATATRREDGNLSDVRRKFWMSSSLESVKE